MFFFFCYRAREVCISSRERRGRQRRDDVVDVTERTDVLCAKTRRSDDGRTILNGPIDNTFVRYRKRLRLRRTRRCAGEGAVCKPFTIRPDVQSETPCGVRTTTDPAPYRAPDLLCDHAYLTHACTYTPTDRTWAWGVAFVIKSNRFGHANISFFFLHCGIGNSGGHCCGVTTPDATDDNTDDFGAPFPDPNRIVLVVSDVA